MTTVTGTAHFQSEQQARAAYGFGYASAISEGRIAIGAPLVKPGQKLLVDKQGRYHIEDPS